MKNSLALKILAMVVIPTVISLGIMEYLNLSRDVRDIMEIETEKEAVLIDSIVKSVTDRMMEGRADQARRLLSELRSIEGIAFLEVYRNNGDIAFEDLETLEHVLEKKRAEGSTGIVDLLEKSRENYEPTSALPEKNIFSDYPTFRTPLLNGDETLFREEQGGVPVLTLLRPLKNEPRCQECHGTDSDIRGIVKISTSQVKNIERVTAHKRAMITTIIVMALFLSAAIYLLIRLFVDRPLRAMVSTIRDISAGDLTRQVPVMSHDEIGVLAENFNVMTGKLRQSQSQLRSWAEELEKEVRRQTDDLRRANEDLKKADQMKSEFLANMSHELRTPLNAVIGFSEVLLDKVFGGLNDKQGKYIENILTSGRHLLRLINEILDLSKIEAGRMDIHLEEFSLERAVYEVVSIIKPLAQKKKIDVSIKMQDAPEVICTDEAKFKQILYNLLSNAVKFTPDGGTVTIDLRGTDAEATISVSDTGIGIKGEHISRIFKEFYQVDSSYSRKYEGTGLGLALTRKIVDLLGGSIEVNSKEGQGSCFIVSLPLRPDSCLTGPPVPHPAARPNIPVSLPAPPAQDTDTPLVLVVEDDPKASELISIYLNQAGYRVIIATNGESAVKLAKETQPFAITLDIMLPKEDGWQIMQELKSNDETKNIPILITSMVDDKNLAFTLGATDYFVKPVDKNRLLQKLGNIAMTARSSQSPVTILAIDDEPKTLELLTAILEPEGYRILTAGGGAEGIRMAREHIPSIILLDLMMPEINGFEVVHALKESLRTRNIPIIIFTAKDLSNEEREALNAEIDKVIPKGAFEKTTLLEEIYRLEKMEPDRAKMIDRLTGIPNYRYLQKRLTEEIGRSERYDRSFSMLMIDIDHFRIYNEANGVILGEAAVKKVAEILKKSLRRADVVTRYIDDKFFLILPETSKPAAMSVAEKIREGVANYPFPYRENMPENTLTVSISIVHYYEDAETIDSLIACAQSTMTEAKAKGGNIIVLNKE